MVGRLRANVRHWTWADASCRGSSHIQTGTRKQDAVSTFTCRSGEIFVAIVSDGAGSASHGGEGASVICRTLGTQIRNHFSSSSVFPTDDFLWDWIDLARDNIAMAATKRSLAPRDFSATMVLAISDGNSTLIAHVGDGSVVVRDSCDAEWAAASWPAQGEYASTTYFVTEDPQARLRISRREAPIDALVAFTDGIERLALNYASDCAHQPFFKGIILPLEQIQQEGRDAGLSAKLRV